MDSRTLAFKRFSQAILIASGAFLALSYACQGGGDRRTGNVGGNASAYGQATGDGDIAEPDNVAVQSRESISGLKRYVDEEQTAGTPDHISQRLDPNTLRYVARSLNFIIDHESGGSGISDYENEPEDVTDREFELEVGRADAALSFSRHTSYIKPRKRIEESGAGEDGGKGNDALILLDTSNSMCLPANYGLYTLGDKHARLYLPSVLAMAISDHYMNDLGNEVSAFTFSTRSKALPFTRSPVRVANLFSYLDCDGTEIDYELMRRTAEGRSSGLDTYVISDEAIFNKEDMVLHVQKFRQAIPDAAFRRLFFIEWAEREDGVTQEILKDAGMRDVYYSSIGSLSEIAEFTRYLNEEVRSGSQ